MLVSRGQNSEVRVCVGHSHVLLAELALLPFFAGGRLAVIYSLRCCFYSYLERKEPFHTHAKVRTYLRLASVQRGEGSKRAKPEQAYIFQVIVPVGFRINIRYYNSIAFPHRGNSAADMFNNTDVFMLKIEGRVSSYSTKHQSTGEYLAALGTSLESCISQGIYSWGGLVLY